MNGTVTDPAPGVYVYKVGPTTGKTSGLIYKTCADHEVDSNYRYMCQDFAELGVEAGDSGSPVYGPALDSPGAKFYGIISAKDGAHTAGSTFSSVRQIGREMGAGTITF